MSPNYQAEFPDYRPEDMPAIPAGWVDQSWHNDACPFFLAAPDLGVFVDYADPHTRECDEGHRFMVVRMEDGMHPAEGGELLLATDEWSEVLAFSERRRHD